MNFFPWFLLLYFMASLCLSLAHTHTHSQLTLTHFSHILYCPSTGRKLINLLLSLLSAGRRCGRRCASPFVHNKRNLLLTLYICSHVPMWQCGPCENRPLPKSRVVVFLYLCNIGFFWRAASCLLDYLLAGIVFAVWCWFSAHRISFSHFLLAQILCSVHWSAPISHAIHSI